MLKLYATFVVRHPYIHLSLITVTCTVFTIIPFLFHDLPIFTDPVVGFETRGTLLSNRFIAWQNLIDETRPSRTLGSNPKEIKEQIRMNTTNTMNGKSKYSRKKSKSKNKNKKDQLPRTHSEKFSEHLHLVSKLNLSIEKNNLPTTKKHSLREIEQNTLSVVGDKHDSDGCGSIMPDYAHVVVIDTANKSLLTFENIKNLCSLQMSLFNGSNLEYYKYCQRHLYLEDVCCPMWSIANYVSVMSGKDSCENITNDDVNKTIAILSECAPYFYNYTFLTSCHLDDCHYPDICKPYDNIYNMLFYLLDSEAFSPNDFSFSFVKSTMIFLPLPRSNTIMQYYDQLDKNHLSHKSLIIPAIDFGLKNALFDLWLIQDTWLVALGGIFVFLSIWVYTQSFLLTSLLFVAVLYSLGVSYFVYIHIFNLQFFPFMNLLVIVVVIGIGADDAFLYVNVWKSFKDKLCDNQENLPLKNNIISVRENQYIEIVENSLKHSVAIMFLTSLTTAVAFFASYISNIPAINCFSVFAGTTVLINFLLMVSFIPVSVYIVDFNFSSCKRKPPNIFYNYVNAWKDIGIMTTKFVTNMVIHWWLFTIVTFAFIGILSIIIVFYYPGLRLPDSKNFQLFDNTHPFEQYDLIYKENFLFENFVKDSASVNMPLRWIWGVKPSDSGNHMNPASKGHLELDENFSISNPDSQSWLLKFCKDLKFQPFYQHISGLLLANCFIESFKIFMSRKCVDKIDRIDRSPCCESSSFPYEAKIFDLCIIKAMESLHSTPRELFIPGIAGPKFLRGSDFPKVVALVIEFESVVPYSMSYSIMDKFFNDVENWTQEQLKNAPPGMQGGWFVSDLQFYDLQKTLASGTTSALLLSTALGFLVLVPATKNLRLSFCAALAMMLSSFVTIAALVLIGWRLNILESIAISTSAGLSVDFSLHYALSYTTNYEGKLNRIKTTLNVSIMPTAAAALTTGFAGIFLLNSYILPYSQIGMFLVLIMVVSWLYATFFLCSLLYVIDTNSSDVSVSDRRSEVNLSLGDQELHELKCLGDIDLEDNMHESQKSNLNATTVIIHAEPLNLKSANGDISDSN